MNRRDSLKALGIGTLSATALLTACEPKTPEKNNTDIAGIADKTGRQDFEIERDNGLVKQSYFTPHEMATIAVLADLIIPKDRYSGSATDAGVPDFIEFIVKDEPQHQLPMRGGLRWLDFQCMNR